VFILFLNDSFALFGQSVEVFKIDFRSVSVSVSLTFKLCEEDTDTLCDHFFGTCLSVNRSPAWFQFWIRLARWALSSAVTRL
jgi:hypothetical protein